MSVHNVIIVGSGPAGLTAAIYAARGNLKPLCIEGYQSGGQLMMTTEVENFPGFEHGIMGPTLMAEIRKQALRFGTEFVTADATKLELTGPIKKVWVDDKVYEAKTVILSTGATANLLGLESEAKYMGKGVSACATCDGFFFKGKEVGVVGGGDSAMEEANFLTRYATKVFLIHRRDSFKASKIMIDRARANPKIEFVVNKAVEEVLGTDKMHAVRLVDTVTGAKSEMKLDGLFVAIGHTPNTRLFKDVISMDEKGYVKTSSDKTQLTATNIPGVYACGDLQDSRYRQAISAAGSGCMAALDAEHYLNSH